MMIEHHKKSHLWEVYEELKKWYETEFKPREDEACGKKKEQDQILEEEYKKDGKEFQKEPFSTRKHMQLSQEDVIKLEEIQFFQNYPWDYECGILRSGSSFGEQALIGNGLRPVSVKCYSDCHLAELDKREFHRVLNKIELRNLNLQIEFLQQVPFLKY